MEEITVNTNKSFFVEILSIGQKIEQELCTFGENCQIKKFLNSLQELIENMMVEDANLTEKVKFIELFKKNVKKFFIFEQLMKNFDVEFFHLEETEFKMVVYFESEKADSYLKKNEEMKILSAKILTLEKSFL